MTRLRTNLRAFLRDESGVMLAEFLILIPVLIWGFIALIVYWDLFRTINVNQKAAYSISDLLSRQEVVTEQFATTGLFEVLKFLVPGAQEPRMRITSFEFDEGPTAEASLKTWGADDKYVLLWSRVTGTTVRPDGFKPVAFVEKDLEGMNLTIIPMMDDGKGAILVETWVDYTPRFDIGLLNAAPGLGRQTFSETIVTFARRRRVCLAGTSTCV
jgi:Flp pilus assembly pilin Flp